MVRALEPPGRGLLPAETQCGFFVPDLWIEGARELYSLIATLEAFAIRAGRLAPSVTLVGAFTFGGQTMAALNFYHYGDQAAGTVGRETPLWQAWIRARFPIPSETSQRE